MKPLAILLTALIVVWLVITIGTGPVSAFVWTSVGDLAWVALLEALLIALTVTVHRMTMPPKDDGREEERFRLSLLRRYVFALLLVFLVAGCASTPPPVIAPTANDSRVRSFVGVAGPWEASDEEWARALGYRDAAEWREDYGLPCVTSNWMYAWIDECGGPVVRITWSEWWALEIADKIAEMREP